jgi:hypothetical protein
MKPIHEQLISTDGYITSFIRNTIKGWWELEVGLPTSWVFDENSKIGCEIILENEIGKLIKIFPKKNNVVIDDLIAFVEIVIETNERIAEKEKQFTDKMQEMKGILEQEAKKFYQELDELKENSFKKNNDNFDKNLSKSKTTTKVTTTKTVDKPKTPRKPRAPRTPKTIMTEKKTISTITEETEDIESSKKVSDAN